MDKSNKLYSSGFTLIEILVVLTIVILLTGVSIAAFSNYNQESQLNKEAQKLVDVLNLTRGKAQTSDINFACSGSDEFGGYRVNLMDIDYDYAFRQCCRDTDTKIMVCADSILQTYKLPGNIRLTANSDAVDFYPLSEGAKPATITLENSPINKCLDVSVLDTGVISVGDLYSC